MKLNLAKKKQRKEKITSTCGAVSTELENTSIITSIAAKKEKRKSDDKMAIYSCHVVFTLSVCLGSLDDFCDRSHSNLKWSTQVTPPQLSYY